MDIEQYDEITAIHNAAIEMEISQLHNFLNTVKNVEEKQKKLKQLRIEKTRMMEELKEKEDQVTKLSHRLIGSSVLLEQERNRTKRALHQSEAIKRRLEDVKNSLSNLNVPENVKIEITNKFKQLENVQHTVTFSDSDTSAVNCSATDSDSWHLFPDRPSKTKRNSGSLALTESSLNSNSTHLTENSEANSILLYSETFESIINRPHDYKIKMLVLGETCCVCELRIQCGKQALKCTSCKAIVHQKCQEQLAKPCIPMDIIKPGNRDIKYFCSTFKPMIPGIVFHCALYIEAKGLDKVGLFALPVYDKGVTRLKELFFKGRGVPNLNKFDVMVVSAFLKDFLGLLSPPLIPFDDFQAFVKYCNITSRENHHHSDLMNDLYRLPSPNRDTLAFLILLFQKVARSPACKMNSYLLAKTFTPILTENVETNSYKKVKQYRKVIQAFIDLPEDLWKRLLISSLQ